MTFCQKICLTLVSKGAPRFDSTSRSTERKGLLIIRDVEQPLWVVRHKGYQDTSNRGAIAWGSSTGLGKLVFVQKAQLSFLLVTASTKLGCLQHWRSSLWGFFFVQLEGFYSGYSKRDHCDLSSAPSADRDIIFGLNVSIALNNLDWKPSGWISQRDACNRIIMFPVAFYSGTVSRRKKKPWAQISLQLVRKGCAEILSSSLQCRTGFWPHWKSSFGAWVSEGRLVLSQQLLCCCDVRHKVVSSCWGHMFRGERSRKRRQDSIEMQSIQELDQRSLNLLLFELILFAITHLHLKNRSYHTLLLV